MRLPSQLPPEPRLAPLELAFPARCLRVLVEARIPFLVGGAYALKHYSGFERETKDVDLFVQRKDVGRTLSALNSARIRTELAFPHWLAKAYSGSHFLDIIFNSGNGLTPVDATWFENAPLSTLLGIRVAICPLEETIWSKAFVMERERYDGADVAHLLLTQAPRIDWARLLWRFGAHWRVLFAHLALFQFIYPDAADTVPSWVMDELSSRIRANAPSKNDPPVCQGTLLSREQYLADLERGYVDARLAPLGTMSTEAVAIWTAAIRTRR